MFGPRPTGTEVGDGGGGETPESVSLDRGRLGAVETSPNGDDHRQMVCDKERSMQDRYVGDVGDFGKYALLQALSVSPESASLWLGVVWYKVGAGCFPDEKHGNDGKHTSYLSSNSRRARSLRGCNEDLCQRLYDIVLSESRTLDLLQKGGVLPDETLFHDEELCFRTLPLNKRHFARQLWLERALMNTRQAQLVFLDPDNGLAPDRVQQYHDKAPKYAFLTDLHEFRNRGQTVIVYQHANRECNSTFSTQLLQRSEQLKCTLNATHVWTLRYHRGTARAYFIIPAPVHVQVITSRIRAFSETSWFSDKHFSLVPTENSL